MLAAVLSAAMSTLSSSLNASASAFLNDFYLPRCQTPPSPKRQLVLSRRMTVVFGILQIGIGIWASHLNDTVVKNALTIAGFSAGLLLGVFLLGVFSKRAGQKAALGGALVGLVVLAVVAFVDPADGRKVAWPWLALIGASTTGICGELIALVIPADQNSHPQDES